MESRLRNTRAYNAPGFGSGIPRFNSSGLIVPVAEDTQGRGTLHISACVHSDIRRFLAGLMKTDAGFTRRPGISQEDFIYCM